MPWDENLADYNVPECYFEAYLLKLNLSPLKGPFYIQSNISGSLETLEVHFCSPVH
jgi:hypothetical protein